MCCYSRFVSFWCILQLDCFVVGVCVCMNMVFRCHLYHHNLDRSVNIKFQILYYRYIADFCFVWSFFSVAVIILSITLFRQFVKCIFTFIQTIWFSKPVNCDDFSLNLFNMFLSFSLLPIQINRWHLSLL